MLKLYKLGGLTYQFEEGKQPEGAVEVKPTKAEPKAAPAETKEHEAPKNKARQVRNKKG